MLRASALSEPVARTRLKILQSKPLRQVIIFCATRCPGIHGCYSQPHPQSLPFPFRSKSTAPQIISCPSPAQCGLTRHNYTFLPASVTVSSPCRYRVATVSPPCHHPINALSAPYQRPIAVLSAPYRRSINDLCRPQAVRGWARSPPCPAATL